MKNPEIHLFIIWQHARHCEHEIIADMASHFTILKRYAITWTPKLVPSNFTRFYGVNLPAHSEKEKECGTGEFVLCIVRDENPIYEERKTSRGPEMVNINMFDAKSRYRSWTEGGHKIHGTNNEKETNHDLTLLLGVNIQDFLSYIPSVESQVESKHCDVVGALGWESLEQMFYVLNNTTSYLVLRGTLAPSNPPEFIDDTDILTRDYENLWKILNGEPAFSPYRPKAKLIIKGNLYYLDIWDSRKNYYDSMWMTEMFYSSVLSKEGIFVLNEENDFYCLLYHCLTNKGNIADKHLPKLQAYKKQLKIQEDDWSKILVDWLGKKHYDIVEHSDPSIPFNISNPIIHAYATRYGKLLRVNSGMVRDVLTGENITWQNRVYKKDNSYVKAGTSWLIDNESKYLQVVGDGKRFPKLIAHGVDNNQSWVEMSAMDGDELFANKWGICIGDIRKYTKQIVELLTVLYNNDIIHRDIQTNNILIDKKGHVSIIDFAFSINFRQDKNFPCPWNLGLSYSPEHMYSDFYNLASIFEYRYGSMPYVKRFAKDLKKIDWEHYPDKEYVYAQLEAVQHDLARIFTIRDVVEFILCKYRIRKYLKHPKKFRRRIVPTLRKPFDYCAEIGRKVVRKIKKILKKII